MKAKSKEGRHKNCVRFFTPSFANALSAQGIIGKMKNSVPQIYHELKRNSHHTSREVHSSVARIDSERPNGGDVL